VVDYLKLNQDGYKMQKPYILTLSFCLVLFTSDCYSLSKTDKIANTYYKNAIELPLSASLEEVFELYARSAELGNRIAQYNLAMMYSNGESVYVDYQQAVYWFSKSVQQKFAPAQYRLGELYYFEKGGLPRDLNKAIELFNKAAKQHDTDAQMNLAMLSGTGEGLPLNKEQALSWLLKARIGGNPMAQTYQKLLNESEHGRFTQEQQKRFWTEKAAELGIREAQEELRQLYPEGADTR
jgi:TPR repeat protein